MNSQKLKIGLPPFGITRFYTYSFLQLFPRFGVDIKVYEDYLEIASQDIKGSYIEAFKLVNQRLSKFKEKSNVRISLPVSANDDKILTKIKTKLGLTKEADLSDIIYRYISYIEGISIENLQKDLYPFTGKGEFSSPSIFKVELYAFTRGAYFTGDYKVDFNLNLHQFMLFIAGYLNARCLRVKKGKDWLTVLLFPPSAKYISDFLIKDEKLKIIKKDINEDVIDKEDKPSSLSPIEAIILWFLFNLEKPDTNLYLVGMKDPAGQKPAETSLDIILPLSQIYTTSKSFIDEIRENVKLRNIANGLIKTALRKEFQDQEKDPDRIQSIDDAVEYIKLLFIACQGGRFKERLELALRSTRRLTVLDPNKSKERYKIAEWGKILASKLLKEKIFESS